MCSRCSENTQAGDCYGLCGPSGSAGRKVTTLLENQHSNQSSQLFALAQKNLESNCVRGYTGKEEAHLPTCCLVGEKGVEERLRSKREDNQVSMIDIKSKGRKFTYRQFGAVGCKTLASSPHISKYNGTFDRTGFSCVI